MLPDRRQGVKRFVSDLFGRQARVPDRQCRVESDIHEETEPMIMSILKRFRSWFLASLVQSVPETRRFPHS
jgi:hypothetical protein